MHRQCVPVHGVPRVPLPRKEEAEVSLGVHRVVRNCGGLFCVAASSPPVVQEEEEHEAEDTLGDPLHGMAGSTRLVKDRKKGRY